MYIRKDYEPPKLKEFWKTNKLFWYNFRSLVHESVDTLTAKSNKQIIMWFIKWLNISKLSTFGKPKTELYWWNYFLRILYKTYFSIHEKHFVENFIEDKLLFKLYFYLIYFSIRLLNKKSYQILLNLIQIRFLNFKIYNFICGKS